jgi:hypothetical protein
MCEFTGNPEPLLDADFERAAKSIDCTVAAVRAVNEVESRGGFFADGWPKILFQRRIFSRMTKRRFNGANPAIADPSSGGSVGDPAEYERLAKAIALDRAAALQSASWGAFQIMGFNHRASGFAAAKSSSRRWSQGRASSSMPSSPSSSRIASTMNSSAAIGPASSAVTKGRTTPRTHTTPNSPPPSPSITTAAPAPKTRGPCCAWATTAKM